MGNTPTTLRNIAEELFTPGYSARACERARHQQSPWNLLFLAFGFAGIGEISYLLFQVMWRVHVAFYPEHAGRFSEFWNTGISFRPFVSSFLLMIPLIFASIPLGFMFACFSIWCIGPARRAMEREAEGVKWASFHESMRVLWLIALIVVPVCLLLSFIGATTLRSLK